MIPTWKRDINTHNRVGQRLREIREAYGLTQTYVAKVIGCSGSAIGHIETGHAGSMELLEAVLWAFGLEMADLHLNRGALVSLQRARRLREAQEAGRKRSPKATGKARQRRGVRAHA